MLNKHLPCPDCFHCTSKEHSIFDILNTEELSFLQSKKGHIILNNGELLFKEGQYPSGFYIITKGKVKISKFGLEGREQILRFAREGNIVGYRVSEEAYTCTATAISEVHVCFLKNEVVLTLFKNNYELVVRFMKLLADDLKTSDSMLMHLTQKSVRERIAESILLLADVYGTEEDGATLNVVLKRNELAGIAGTIRETATRFLSEFNESHIIELTGKKIKILDMQRLQQTANASF